MRGSLALRSLAFDYASSDDALSSGDDDDDDLLARAYDRFEQRGGALRTPLFTTALAPVGPRRRWRNVVTGIRFEATLRQNREPTPNDDIGEAIVESFHSAIEHQLGQLHARIKDQMTFTLQSPDFNHAYESTKMEVGEFVYRTRRIDILLQHIPEKLNSNESLDPSRGFIVTFHLVSRLQRGRGKRKKNIMVGRRSMEVENKKKRCIVAIDNDDTICCARAIVTMRAYCHKDDNTDGRREWENIRKGDGGGYTVQRTRASELHRLANVPEGPCGLDELRRFQDFLAPAYQLVVMCRQRPFALIYKGPTAAHQIRMIKANTHYDGCTSFSGFVNRSYWCDKCDKAFNTDDARNHPCTGTVCRQCRNKNCPDRTNKPKPNVLCHLCNGFFFGDACLAEHYRKKLCQKYVTCPRCCKTYEKKKKSKKHVCGVSKCYSCKEMVQLSTHKCYIQPEDDQEQEEESGSDSESGGEKKEKPTPLLVYGDIETMVEDDRTFTPVLLVYRTSEDDDFHVLTGEDCCEQFMAKNR